MELKRELSKFLEPLTSRFNRTFMELKRRILSGAEFHDTVLIGPSWN